LLVLLHQFFGALLTLCCGKMAEAIGIAVVVVDLVGFGGLLDLGPVQLGLQLELFGFPFPGVSVQNF
jgi:hypothetical protein